jgi:hypothetical protein
VIYDRFFGGRIRSFVELVVQHRHFIGGNEGVKYTKKSEETIHGTPDFRDKKGNIRGERFCVQQKTRGALEARIPIGISR